MPSIYEVPVDPDAENNTHAFVLGYIGFNKSVLEVGCSTGYLTRVMVERGCDVVGMELDPEAAEQAGQWAERVVVGNIDERHIWDEVKDEAFDVVVLSDVLEHLFDPAEALRQAVRKLKPSGYVVASLPNVAHGDVRLSLMRGEFRYREKGLLDRTHVRFFTLETARQLMRDAGLVVLETKRAVIPLFLSELRISRRAVSQETLAELYADPELESYQWVMKAVRDSGDLAVADLARQVEELTDRVHNQRVRITLLRKGLRDNRITDDHIRALDDHIAEHKRYIAALEGHVSGLEHNIEVLNQALVEADAKYRAAADSSRPSLPRRLYGKVRRRFGATSRPGAM